MAELKQSRKAVNYFLSGQRNAGNVKLTEKFSRSHFIHENTLKKSSVVLFLMKR